MLRDSGPSESPDEGSLPEGEASHGAPHFAEARPDKRTPGLIFDELQFVRDQLDRSLARGELRRAGECSFELEQLHIEMAKAGVS